MIEIKGNYIRSAPKGLMREYKDTEMPVIRILGWTAIGVLLTLVFSSVAPH